LYSAYKVSNIFWRLEVLAGQTRGEYRRAFAVRYGRDFTGRKFCLVDDIKTIGVTLDECIRTLKEAGATKVFALVFAVAGQKL